MSTENSGQDKVDYVDLQGRCLSPMQKRRRNGFGGQKEPVVVRAASRCVKSVSGAPAAEAFFQLLEQVPVLGGTASICCYRAPCSLSALLFANTSMGPNETTVCQATNPLVLSKPLHCSFQQCRYLGCFYGT